MASAGHFLLSVIVLVRCLYRLRADSQCEFPDYLQTGPVGMSYEKRWLCHVRHQGMSLAGQVSSYTTYVDRNLMSVLSQTGNVLTQAYTLECLGKEGGRYRVKKVEATQESQVLYNCMEFLWRSDNVVMVKLSPLQSQLTPDPCDSGVDLVLNPWPMISLRFPKQHIPDDLVGGFQVDFIDLKSKSMSSPGCTDLRSSSARLMISCDFNPSIQIDFTGGCVPRDLAMHAETSLLSLAHWRKGDTSFMILTESRLNHFKPKLWCLAVPDRLGSDPARLFLDVSCDIDGTTDPHPANITLNMIPFKWDNLCTDRNTQCNAGLQSGKLNCQSSEDRRECALTCSACPRPIQLIDSKSWCSFNESFAGNWFMASSEDALLAVTIDSSTVHLPLGTNMFCVPNITAASTRFPVVSFSSKGCPPKLACLEFDLKASVLLRFRISHALSMSDAMESLEASSDSVCGDEQFSDRYDPLSDTTFTSHYINLLHYTSSDFTDCGLGGSDVFYTFQTELSNGEVCRGKLSTDCQSPSLMHLNPTDCPSLPSKTFACLASFSNADNDRYVVTMTKETVNYHVDIPAYNCLIFTSSGEDLYALHSPYCHEGTLREITSEGEHVGHYTRLTVQRDGDEDICHATTYGQSSAQPVTSQKPPLLVFHQIVTVANVNSPEPSSAVNLSHDLVMLIMGCGIIVMMSG